MARYFMTLSYDGTPFHGWQIQPHDNSVQETIEKALAVLLHTPTTITGAGRTDTGVNAAMMVAHFDTAKPLNPQELHNLLRSLNAMVGRAIAIYGIVPVAPDAHARFDATSRTYKYFVHTRKSPFLNSYSWHCHYKAQGVYRLHLIQQVAHRRENQQLPHRPCPVDSRGREPGVHHHCRSLFAQHGARHCGHIG